jgi:glycosyltransferase domain-containing protein
MTTVDKCKAITLLIPTKGRPKFLRRTLMYYRSLSFTGNILILDSSVGSDLEEDITLVNELRQDLNIGFHCNPEMSELAATRFLIDLVRTPYVAELQDDNFLVPRGISTCIEFLENNQSYSACRGIGISIKTNESAVYGRIRKCVLKKQPQSEQESASLRYLELMNNYSDIHFAVHRTEIYKFAFDQTTFEDSLFFKILATAQIFIAGKVKSLKTMYLVRHIQDSPYRTQEASDIYFWLTRPSWIDYLSIHRKNVVEKLMEQDGLSVNDAEEIFRRGLMAFLLWLLISYAPEEVDSTTGKLRNTSLNSVHPFSRYSDQNWPFKIFLFVETKARLGFELFRNLFNKIDVVDNDVLNTRTTSMLSALTGRKSIYSDDFIPIYRSITEIIDS